MRRHLLQFCAALLLLAAAGAESAVINNTAATITYNDDHSFGSFATNSENSSFGSTFGNLIFNAVPNVEASSGQSSNNATSFIWLTIKAAPGYALTNVGFNESGSWATSNFGSVDVEAQGGIVDTATGTPLNFNPIFVAKNSNISGSSLAAGTWFMSDSFAPDPFTPAPNEITIAVARTLSASGGSFGNGGGLIGNTQFPFFSGTGLSVFYTAQLIPEPATYVISALGFVLLMAVRLKRQ